MGLKRFQLDSRAAPESVSIAMTSGHGLCVTPLRCLHARIHLGWSEEQLAAEVASFQASTAKPDPSPSAADIEAFERSGLLDHVRHGGIESVLAQHFWFPTKPSLLGFVRKGVEIDPISGGPIRQAGQ
jgi:hypothetical protein